MGLDEAGRGSFLGPLVVGAFRIRAPDRAQLRAIGVRDSKLLSPARRRELAQRLRTLGEVRLCPLPPTEIDRAVVRHGLNRLELDAFARLAGDWSASMVVADACDANARRFEQALAERLGPETRVVARHRADRTDPVVGAASIVAKVERDRWLAELARALGLDLGSGYPSDPRSVRAVTDVFRTTRRWPDWARASWSTKERVMAALGRRTLDEPFG